MVFEQEPSLSENKFSDKGMSNWADYIRLDQNNPGFDWVGGNIDPAYDGIDFNFIGSPALPTVEQWDKKKIALFEAGHPVVLNEEQQAIRRAIADNKKYHVKYSEAGVTLNKYYFPSNYEHQPWMFTVFGEAQSRVFRDIPDICKFLRNQAKKHKKPIN